MERELFDKELIKSNLNKRKAKDKRNEAAIKLKRRL